MIWICSEWNNWPISVSRNWIVLYNALKHLVTESGTTLDIRQGLTSQSPLVETLISDVVSSPTTMSSEYLVPSDIGFYVRLRGRLSSEFKMAIAYAAFTYTGNLTLLLDLSHQLMKFCSHRMLYYEGLCMFEPPMHLVRFAMWRAQPLRRQFRRTNWMR